MSDCRLAVFAPSPILTITIEARPDGPEVHLHPGGQGFWVARLAGTLGASVTFCCALGGEPGKVLEGLLAEHPLVVRAVKAGTPNGVYVHDRRSGERIELVSVESRPLGRHAADELYGIALGSALDAGLMLLTGCQPDTVVDAELYRRLASDLRANGRPVIADLTGGPLRAALTGGLELLKLSDEELVREGYASSTRPDDLVEGMSAIRGARAIIVTRAAEPALLMEDGDGRVVELAAPVFEAIDHRGAGDSLFAATGVGLGRGMALRDALRLGMAAGALNATRRGLGTGTRVEIERLAEHVSVRPRAT